MTNTGPDHPLGDLPVPAQVEAVVRDEPSGPPPDLTWIWPGAKWWKVDFHAHSMASFDYGMDASNEAELKRRLYRDWLLDFMAAEVDCVVIADHNIGAGIDLARAALADLTASKPAGFRSLVVIPGVEITANGGTHVTAVLPMATDSGAVDRLLGAVGYTDTPGSSTGVTQSSITQVIGAIAATGGMAIASHADANAGLFRLSVATLEQALKTEGLAGVELERHDAPLPTGIAPNLLPRVSVAGSDSHHPTGNPGQAFPGSRYTWVKSESPTTEGIRLALLDGELSLLRSDRTDEDPNRIPSNAVLSVEVSHTTHVGIDQPVRIEFSPWLNAIIGGRGTGKSTFVELIRLALGRGSELPDPLATEFARYRTVRPAGTDGALGRVPDLL